MSDAQKQLDTRLGNYIPEQLHVARQTRGSDEIVGFVVPITGEEQWSKDRARKADAWASSGYNRTHALESIQVSNNWQANFSMIKQVRRNESDAVYWRVLHPQGFEFEMSLDNFEYFLEKYTIDQGLIVQLDDSLISGVEVKPVELRLVYNKRNTKWILVDKEHPEYKSAKNNLIPGCTEHVELVAQAKADEKAARKTLTPGDVFKYGSDKATFLGTVSVAFPKEDIRETPEQIKRMKVIRVHENRYTRGIVARYYFLNQLKVHEISASNPENYTAESAVAEINHALTHSHSIRHNLEIDIEMPRNSARPVAVWLKKPKTITQKLTPVDLPAIVDGFVPDMILGKTSFENWPKHLRIHVDDDWHHYYDNDTKNVIVRHKETGETWVPLQDSNRNRYSNYTGWNYGIFRLKFRGDLIDMATYYDHEEQIMYSQEARRQRDHYERRLQENPLDGMAQRMLKSSQEHLDELVAKKREEIADKQWYFNDEYELLQVTYE